MILLEGLWSREAEMCEAETSERVHGVLVIRASGVSTSFFNEFISAKHACMKHLNSLTSSLLKNRSCSFMLRVSL